MDQLHLNLQKEDDKPVTDIVQVEVTEARQLRERTCPYIGSVPLGFHAHGTASSGLDEFNGTAKIQTRPHDECMQRDGK